MKRMTTMKTLRALAMSLVFIAAALVVPASRADSFTFSFATTPASGAISGAAGATIGWGYTITNLDPDHWLVASGLNSDLFQHATPDAFLFDLPVLAPGATLTVSYSPGLAGLFELTWDNNAPVGFTNVGNFVLSADFYSGDPFNGGYFLQSGQDQQTPYAATVLSPVNNEVPEPASALLFASGLCAFAARRRIRQRGRNPASTGTAQPKSVSKT